VGTKLGTPKLLMIFLAETACPPRRQRLSGTPTPADSSDRFAVPIFRLAGLKAHFKRRNCLSSLSNSDRLVDTLVRDVEYAHNRAIAHTRPNYHEARMSAVSLPAET
jgi:hypothetical protein